MQGDEITSEDEVASATKLTNRLSMLAYIGVVVAIAVVVAYVSKFGGTFSDKPEAWGQFGDYVGGLLNPTFSFLALLALLATLGLQVRELRLSAKELRNSAEALVKQNETMQKQTFEATFFQSLKLHNDIVASMQLPSRDLAGRACFEYLLSELEGHLINEGANKSLDALTFQYEFFYREHQALLGHYFRLLYNLVKLVKRTEGIDNRFYTNLIRAQLSSAELKLIFYNCLSDWGREKFKPLVEEFALLKTLPNDVVPYDELLHAYSPDAFGGEYPGSWL